MRDFDLGRRFSRILLPYNGLFTLASDADVAACFSAVARHLEADGYFIFDIWVPDVFHHEALADQVARGSQTERPRAASEDADTDADTDFGDSDEAVASLEYRGRHYDVYESTRWDPLAQRIDATYTHVPRGGGPALVSEVMSRYVLSTQLDALLESAGLEVVVRHGDFDQCAWESESERLVLTAQLISPEA